MGGYGSQGLLRGKRELEWVDSFYRATRRTRHGDNVGLVWILELIHTLARPNENVLLQNSNGWHWRLGQQQLDGWILTHEQWNSIITTPGLDCTHLNRRWHNNLTRGKWVSIWKKVWGSMTFHHDRVVIWRVLQHGFFTNKRALIWKVNEGNCPLCHIHTETTEHLFFECWYVRRRWAAIVVRLMGTRLATIFMKGSLGEILYEGIMRAQRSPIILVIIVEMLVGTWRERNSVCYSGIRSQIPVKRLLSGAKAHCRALVNTCESRKK